LSKKAEPAAVTPVIEKKVADTTTPTPAPVEKEPPIPNCDDGRPPVEIDPDEIDGVIERWADAWTNKDFSAYKSFYSRKFKGIKRTIRHRTTHYNYRTWMGDRGGMLRYARWTKLEVKDLKIVCASEKEIKIEFTQVYQSTTYNDIGPKTITLVRDGEELKIIYEEMLSSEPL